MVHRQECAAIQALIVKSDAEVQTLIVQLRERAFVDMSSNVVQVLYEVH